MSKFAKVASDGTWLPYAGWTILFDTFDGHPAASLSVGSRTLDIARRLGEIAAADPALAPLPAAGHHVTVCDGMNPRRAARARRRTNVPEVARPATHPLPPAVDDALRALTGDPDARVAYTPAGVEVRGSAVVLALVPTPATQLAHDGLASRRRELQRELGRALGLDISNAWRPHLTIAYHTGRAPSVSPSTMEELSAMQRAHPTPLTASGIGVYSFESMVSFQRIGPAAR